jgi:hypothetical protein
MNSKLPRRTFLIGWLSGLLAGWLGRSQAQATPRPTPRPIVPNSTSRCVTTTVSDGSSCKEMLFRWTVASAPRLGS